MTDVFPSSESSHLICFNYIDKKPDSNQAFFA